MLNCLHSRFKYPRVTCESLATWFSAGNLQLYRHLCLISTLEPCQLWLIKPDVIGLRPTRTLSGYSHSIRLRPTKHVVSSRPKSLRSTAQPTVDRTTTGATTIITTSPATTTPAPMTITTLAATTAPAPMTTELNVCHYFVSNDFCETTQIPTMIGNRPRTHQDKGGLSVCGTGADISNLVCVQTNKWDLPTTVNTNVRRALAGKLGEIKVIKRHLRCRYHCYN